MENHVVRHTKHNTSPLSKGIEPEIIAIYCDERLKHVNVIWGKNRKSC
jgi:hypothetical protein